MIGVVEIYTDALYNNFKPLHANWEPGRPIQLGDFGVMRGRTFVHVGNIKDVGVKFSEIEDETTDDKQFTSTSDINVTFHAKGTTTAGVVNAKAGLEVAFGSKDAVFFNAADCKYNMIANKAAVGKSVLALYEKEEWQREWVVVTDLVKAGATTVAISGGASASIVFEATGDADRIDLADASVGIAVKSSRNVGYKVVAGKGLYPLIGLCKIQSAFPFWPQKFRPVSAAIGDFGVRAALEDSTRVRTEDSPSALYFGQLN